MHAWSKISWLSTGLIIIESDQIASLPSMKLSYLIMSGH